MKTHNWPMRAAVTMMPMIWWGEVKLRDCSWDVSDSNPVEKQETEKSKRTHPLVVEAA